MKGSTSILLAILFCSLIGCTENTQDKSHSENTNGWEIETRVTKKVEQYSFTFPSAGYAYDHRDSLVEVCLDAIQENAERINLAEFSEPIKFIFLNSRSEMEEEVGYSASGWTNIWTQEVHILANNEFTPPIKHEVLHMISMTTWGYPHDNLIWMNEGLATTTEEFCNGYTVPEIYRYFLENRMLLPMDSLTDDFFGSPSIISYHQSAHIVDYLLLNYGLEKFEELWKAGFESFERIYNISFAELQEELNRETMEKHPTVVSIDWKVFSEGCF